MISNIVRDDTVNQEYAGTGPRIDAIERDIHRDVNRLHWFHEDSVTVSSLIPSKIVRYPRCPTIQSDLRD